MIFKTFKAQISCSALAACLFFSQPALAQNVPVFTPASNWQVGSTELSKVRGLQAMKLPCVVSAEYDNGFVVRFSGGGSQMLAMAIDFRQDVFVQGRKYDAMVTIGDSYVKQVSATAFTPNTLIFNLRPIKDFYPAARNGQMMEVTIDSNIMKFSLAQLAASYDGLERCYAGENVAPAKPMMTAAKTANKGTDMPPVAVPVVEKTAMTPLPQTFDDIVKGADERTQVPAVKTAQPRTPTTISPRVSKAQTETSSALWTAKAGEDMRNVLGRWAETAGYDLDWQTAQAGTVVQDVSLNGRFEDAVSQLLAENSAGTGITGRVETAQGAKPLSAGAPTTNAGWTAPAGADMKSTLTQWGSRAGVNVVWKSSPSMNVKQPVNASGSFESAVQMLLDQYMNDVRRPVGQLNVDPETGVRTLIIDMDQSG